MKIIQVERTGGPEVLKLTDIAGLEPPAPGQALVRIVSAGVNFIDINQRRGTYPRELPFTPGQEASGVVESIADGPYDHIKASDRVVYADQPGAYAEASLVSVDRLILLPDEFTFETGAAFPVQGMTAHYLIHEFRKLKPGDVVLIHAAAGGVGSLLVQWARHLGARVIATVSTEQKAMAARESGADVVILYTEEDFAPAVMRATQGHGADLIIDGVGRFTARGNLQAAAIGGHIVVFGASSGPAEAPAPSALAPRQLSFSRGALANFTATREELVRRATDVMRGMREGWLSIHIDQVLPLAQAEQAHQLMESRSTTGKILLVNKKV